jgi:undecaprenyl-diphosphatase
MSPRRWASAVALAVGTGGFALLARAVQNGELRIDERLLDYLTPERQSHAARDVYRLFDLAVGEYQGLVFAVALIVLLLIFRRPLAAALTALLIGGALAATEVLKPHFDRPALIDHRTGYFPSTHAAGAMAFCIACVACMRPPRWRWPVGLAAAAIVVFYGATLVYTRSHYPSDVAAGYFVALAVAGAIGFVAPSGSSSRGAASASRSSSSP